MDITKHPKFMDACKKVANDWRELGHAILKENAYASHVTEQQKIDHLNEHLELADRIEKGEITSFTIWQRINQELTGECVGFLSK
jgi:hypothetical protein